MENLGLASRLGSPGGRGVPPRRRPCSSTDRNSIAAAPSASDTLASVRATLVVDAVLALDALLAEAADAGAGFAVATCATGAAVDGFDVAGVALGVVGRGVATGVMSTSCSTRLLNSLVTSFIRCVISVERASASRLATSRNART